MKYSNLGKLSTSLSTVIRRRINPVYFHSAAHRLKISQKAVIAIVRIVSKLLILLFFTLLFFCDLIDVMDDLYTYTNPKNNKHSPLVSKQLNEIVQKHADVS